MLDIKNVSYAVEDKTILKSLKTSLSQGQHMLLLGPSGCGKTTLLNILSTLLPPSGGDVSFQGVSYSGLDDNARASLRANSFGFIFQKLHLIGHLSAFDNIAMAQPQQDPSRVRMLLDDLGLLSAEKQKCRDLSVGEAQRVSIARALANNPKIIFADEPTSALDDVNANIVMGIIFDQAQKTGASIIAATHDARIKPLFSNVLEMRGG